MGKTKFLRDCNTGDWVHFTKTPCEIRIIQDIITDQVMLLVSTTVGHALRFPYDTVVTKPPTPENDPIENPYICDVKPSGYVENMFK